MLHKITTCCDLKLLAIVHSLLDSERISSMSKIQRTIREMSWDERSLHISGFAFILIGVLSFFPTIEFLGGIYPKITLVAIGILLRAIVAQNSLRKHDLEEFTNALGATSVELIGDSRSFKSHFGQNILVAKKDILQTLLTSKYTKITHPTDNPDHPSRILYERVSNSELSYKRVELILSSERLKHLVYRLILYEGLDYLVRYYAEPPVAIPVLNMLSIDNEGVYLGGFYTSDPPRKKSYAVYIRSQDTSEFLKAYWDNLWQSAKPLNEGKQIDWEELKKIAHRYNMNEKQFDEYVEKTRTEIKRKAEIKKNERKKR